MGVQTSLDNNTIPFIRLSNPGSSKLDATILQDAGRSIALAFATVMARLLTEPGDVTAGTNTGNGTATLAFNQSNDTPIVGDYNLECAFVVAEGGVFKLEDPNGNLVADNLTLRVGASLVTTFTVAGLTIAVTEGTTDFDAGDTFALTVAAVNKWRPLDPTESDYSAYSGFSVARGIYLGPDIIAADIVAGDIEDVHILTGGNTFVDVNQIILEGSLTIDSVLPSGKTVRDALVEISIIPEGTVDISGFENA